ncbi:hypothetical protein KAU33_02235, partial [Candidatus Dependentiae bacterium]|nr:hypothetical protein [Candidatus Dependentiae bacterium]
EDSVEDIFPEFFRLIRSGHGSEAFIKYVDIEDFMILMRFNFNPSIKDDKAKQQEVFLKFWTKNSRKINELFLKEMKKITQITEVKIKDRKKDIYTVLITSNYINGDKKKEEVQIKKTKDGYRIILSTLKEISDD